jgi:hypothetical protein
MNIKSYSQSAQDIFVVSVLDRKRNGTYLEIGSAVPVENNNTYLLESEFDWTGISFELNEELNESFRSVRKNPVISGDATLHDYSKLIEENNLPTHIDYLQIDIDPYWQSFKCLKAIDFDKFEFSVITFEHDYWCGGSKERMESREILESKGYTRVISDVMDGAYSMEDWYVNEKFVSKTWKEFVNQSIDQGTIRNDLMNHLKEFDYQTVWWYTA